jgi:hypothetical protein
MTPRGYASTAGLPAPGGTGYDRRAHRRGAARSTDSMGLLTIQGMEKLFTGLFTPSFFPVACADSTK